MVLMFFYKKEGLKGKRLHEVDQDIVHIRLVFKLYVFVLLKMVFIKSHLKDLQIIIAMIKASLYQLVFI